jgi:hypothetical protein
MVNIPCTDVVLCSAKARHEWRGNQKCFSCPKHDRPRAFKIGTKGASKKGRSPVMFYPLDIFKTDSDGGVLWRGSAETFIAAKARIQTLALSCPGEYLVLNQHTGDSVIVLPDVRPES